MVVAFLSGWSCRRRGAGWPDRRAGAQAGHGTPPRGTPGGGPPVAPLAAPATHPPATGLTGRLGGWAMSGRVFSPRFDDRPAGRPAGVVGYGHIALPSRAPRR